MAKPPETMIAATAAHDVAAPAIAGAAAPATADAASADLAAFTARPKRADARRNYDKLVTAAREAFAEEGSGATLEEISRRAGVGIGTLYRHFPKREDLLEATYLGGVEEICAAASKYTDLPPWDALTGWLREFVSFAATKRALAEEMFTLLDRDAPVFRSCGNAIFDVGEPLLQRAQAAGEVRADVDISDVTRMISGIAGLRRTEPEQIERLVAIAIDGLRPPG